jgi:uncharacterized membrane-anchored protein
MNTRMKVATLAILSVAQLAAAAWSIARYESTLRTGILYRIRTMPVDPADAFRGRYVAVRPAILLPKPIASETEKLLYQIQSGERGYAILETDADGFARVAQILPQPPSQGDYLEIAHAWQQWGRESDKAVMLGYNVEFSFDRYYMNEADAPVAQDRYAEMLRRNPVARAWLAVRVKNGVGVIEGLFINGVAIETIVAAPPN